jgi:hypothetical protein
MGPAGPAFTRLNNTMEERVIIPAELGGQSDSHFGYETAVSGSIRIFLKVNAVLHIGTAPFTELPYTFISVFDQVWLSRQRAGLQVTERDL